MTLATTPEAMARLAVDEAVKRGYKHIARITSVQDGVLANKTHFDALNANKIDVALDEEFPLEVKDFRTYISKVKSRKKPARYSGISGG